MMKRLLLALTLCATLYSCDTIKDNDETAETGKGTFILNNGNWGDNDSNVGIYDPTDKTYTPSAFYGANGQNLGDLGQDVIAMGEEVYIAMNGSQTIWVTGSDLKIKKQVNAEHDGARLSPKSMVSVGGKVYVSYYEGFVGEISSSDYSVRICPVGPNPEGIAAAEGKLYVAASGGMSYPDYNNTVSIVSLDSFTQTASIEVNVNPAKVEASSNGSYVYITSFGNYYDIPALLQVYNTSTGDVSTLEYSSVSAIAKGSNDVLYILCGGYDENWNPLPGSVYTHDMTQNKALGAFIADETTLSNAYSISVDRDGYVYVGCSDYKNNGDMYVFTPAGKLHDRFDSAGLNPLKAY